MISSRRGWAALLTAALVAVGLSGGAAAGSALAAAPALPSAAASQVTYGATLQVGRLTLHRCGVVPGAYCGRLAEPWDPSGQVRGDISVGFAFVPASDRSQPVLGTVVPHEGGPGYSTTGSGVDYAAMYGSLLTRRNLLLVDQRGTGLTAPINCPELEHLVGPYDVAAARCAKRLGSHADLYGSASSADDLAGVITALRVGKVDLYGDSYGTFFAQVFAGRHGDQLRSVVLDSAYPPTGETAWYPTQTAAMTYSIDAACAHTIACAAANGATAQLLSSVLAQVRRHPYTGVAYNADGARQHVVVDGKALVSLTFGATYGPAWYRELAAALHAALTENRAPLLRLVAEAVYTSSYPSDVVAYSEGLDAATSCHDYPQLYDMSKPPAVRKLEYVAAVRAEGRTDPGVYAPFTIAEYLASDWEEQDWCLTWPVPSSAHPAGPPAPPTGHYPSVPVVVLSSELDSITTPAEGRLVVAEFPNARQVLIAGSFHVSAEDDVDGCSSSILRAFVADPVGGLTTSVLACAPLVPPVRAVPSYVSTYRAMPGATALAGSTVGAGGLRAASTAAETVADVIDRWYNNYSGVGVGLYGGSWSYTGDHVTRFRLHDVRLTPDLAVSGTVVWSRYGHVVTVHLTIKQVDASGAIVRGSGVAGTVDGAWDSRAAGAQAVLRGILGGKVLAARMLAP